MIEPLFHVTTTPCEKVPYTTVSCLVPVPPVFELKEEALKMYIEYEIVDGEVTFQVWVSAINGIVRYLALNGTVQHLPGMDIVEEIKNAINQAGLGDRVVSAYKEAISA